MLSRHTSGKVSKAIVYEAVGFLCSLESPANSLFDIQNPVFKGTTGPALSSSPAAIFDASSVRTMTLHIREMDKT